MQGIVARTGNGRWAWRRPAARAGAARRALRWVRGANGRTPHCPQLLKLIGSREYLLDDSEMYSLKDIADLQAAKIQPLILRDAAAFREQVAKI